MRGPGIIFALRSDGTECPIEASISCVLDGGDKLFVAILRDVSEKVAFDEWRRVAENSLSELKARLALAIKGSGFGVWEFDFSHGRLIWDDAMFALYGMTREDFDGTLPQWRSRIHPEDVSIFDRRLGDLAASEFVSPVMFRAYRLDDGREICIESNGYLTLQGPGMPRRLVGMSRDVTARVRADRELRRLNTDLGRLVDERTRALEEALLRAEKVSEAKSGFLSVVSHELRTPLHSILGFASLLLEDGASGEVGRKYVEKIIKHGGVLLTLIDDLLDSAKIQAGTFNVRREKIDLSKVIDALAEEFSLIARSSGVTLTISRPDYAAYQGDAMRLGQALRNVLANAVRFSPSGADVELRMEADDDCYRIIVSDQGRGIPEGELETIFDSFTQSSLTGAKDGGTGLGLPIARGIIAAHGGSIHAENNHPTGARFVTTLPRC